MPKRPRKQAFIPDLERRTHKLLGALEAKSGGLNRHQLVTLTGLHNRQHFANLIARLKEEGLIKGSRIDAGHGISVEVFTLTADGHARFESLRQRFGRFRPSTQADRDRPQPTYTSDWLS